MKQKQALGKIIQSLDIKEARYNLVINWLEDINWHSECTMLRELTKELKPQFDKQHAVITANRRDYMYNHEMDTAKHAPHYFNLIFGWGLLNDGGWRTNGMGKDFVDELVELIELKNK